jgi:hypothetical protein
MHLIQGNQASPSTGESSTLDTTKEPIRGDNEADGELKLDSEKCVQHEKMHTYTISPNDEFEGAPFEHDGSHYSPPVRVLSFDTDKESKISIMTQPLSLSEDDGSLKDLPTTFDVFEETMDQMFVEFWKNLDSNVDTSCQENPMGMSNPQTQVNQPTTTLTTSFLRPGATSEGQTQVSSTTRSSFSTADGRPVALPLPHRTRWDEGADTQKSQTPIRANLSSRRSFSDEIAKTICSQMVQVLDGALPLDIRKDDKAALPNEEIEQCLGEYITIGARLATPSAFQPSLNSGTTYGPTKSHTKADINGLSTKSLPSVSTASGTSSCASIKAKTKHNRSSSKWFRSAPFPGLGRFLKKLSENVGMVPETVDNESVKSHVSAKDTLYRVCRTGDKTYDKTACQIESVELTLDEHLTAGAKLALPSTLRRSLNSGTTYGATKSHTKANIKALSRESFPSVSTASGTSSCDSTMDKTKHNKSSSKRLKSAPFPALARFLKRKLPKFRSN